MFNLCCLQRESIERSRIETEIKEFWRSSESLQILENLKRQMKEESDTAFASIIGQMKQVGCEKWHYVLSIVFSLFCVLDLQGGAEGKEKVEAEETDVDQKQWAAITSTVQELRQLQKQVFEARHCRRS